MSVAPNPLIAQRVDTTTAWSGIFLAEDIEGIVSGFESGSWIEVGIGGFAASMDVLALVLDPLGQLVAWGVAWLMEHVKPLSDALDALAGDPDQITAFAQTWHNVANAVGGAAEELRGAVDRETMQWLGATADAYRNHAGEQQAAMIALKDAADAIGSIVEGAGLVVALVRGLVRDLIAEFVGVLAVRIWVWLAEEACTLGLATPLVIAQVSSLVAKWVGRIAHLLSGLVKSIKRLMPILRRLDEIIQKLTELLRRLRRAATSGPSGPRGGPQGGPGRPPIPDGPSGGGPGPGSTPGGGGPGPGSTPGGGPGPGTSPGGPGPGPGGTPDGPSGGSPGGPPARDPGSGAPPPDPSGGRPPNEPGGGGPPREPEGGPPRPEGGGDPPRDPNAPPPPEPAGPPREPDADGTPGTPESTHPNIHLGEMGDDFRPGVADPDGHFSTQERSIADYFEQQGAHVTPVERIDDVDGLKNPDSVIRRSPDDPGTITEMKTLESGDSTAVRREILNAGEQVGPHGGGDAIIDGRNVGLTEEEARRGFARAMGQAAQHGQEMPRQVHIILGNGQLLTLPDR
jgi:hypothetical protein